MDVDKNPVFPMRRPLLTSLSAVPLVTAITALPRASMAAGAMPANWYDADSKKIQREIASRSGTKIVLLGTGGGPVIGRSRRQTSVLMLHDEDAYMLDFGLGAVQQFARTGTSFSQVRSLFLTLQRPDHTTDYGPFLLQGWIHGLNSSVQAYGPPGLTTMTGGYIKAMKHTIEFWSESFDIPPLKPIATQEFTRGGFVMQDGTVRVTSALVKHPPVVPAFGYRFDFKDRSVAFSGDTAPTQSMINLAKGADVLIHEAMYVPAMGVSMRDDAKRQKVGFDAVVEHMIADHTAVEDVGKIAQAAGVKELVLYHLAPPGSHLTDEDWIAPAAKYFNGKIVVGRDLMMI